MHFVDCKCSAFCSALITGVYYIKADQKTQGRAASAQAFFQSSAALMIAGISLSGCLLVLLLRLWLRYRPQRQVPLVNLLHISTLLLELDFITFVHHALDFLAWINVGFLHFKPSKTRQVFHPLEMLLSDREDRSVILPIKLFSRPCILEECVKVTEKLEKASCAKAIDIGKGISGTEPFRKVVPLLHI